MSISNNLAKLGIILGLTLTCSEWQAQAQGGTASPSSTSPPPQRRVEKKKESFLTWLLRFAGVTATASKQKGDNDEGEGNIYVADLLKDERFPLGREGAYRWPIFLPCDKSVLALKGDQIVKISWKGEEQTVSRARDVVKLVGVSSGDPNEVLVVVAVESSRRALGTLSLKSGEVTLPSFDDTLGEDGDKMRKQALDAAEGSGRTYGNTSLYVEAQTAPGSTSTPWSDVMLVEEGSGAPTQPKPRNVSLCNGDKCTQPSLSPEGRYVVYIKLPRHEPRTSAGSGRLRPPA